MRKILMAAGLVALAAGCAVAGRGFQVNQGVLIAAGVTIAVAGLALALLASDVGGPA